MHNYPMSNISHTYLNNKTHYRVYANCNCQRYFMDRMKGREVVPVFQIWFRCTIVLVEHCAKITVNLNNHNILY